MKSSLIIVTMAFTQFYTGGAQTKAEKKCQEWSMVKNDLKCLDSLEEGQQIIGGIYALENEFPHMVALGFGNPRKYRWLCGGTLISENFVIAAAHCTSDRELGNVKVVKVGTRNLKTRRAGKIIAISRIIKHPDYKPPSLYNDITLLRLKTKLDLTKSVFPACLNTATNVRRRTKVLIATGWGFLDYRGEPSNNLMKVDLELLIPSQCGELYKNTPKKKLADGIRYDSQMCAVGALGQEKDTCYGDSGGPLVIKVGPKFTLVGITSFGRGCAINRQPGVYTNISHFVPWIAQTIWP